MVDTISFKSLILRAVLRHVSPMVIRLISVSDQTPLPEFHDLFRAVLGWDGDLGYIIRVHAQEFNSFRRKTRATALHEFKLHRQEKFLYICDTLHMWEWDIRVLDIQAGVEGDQAPVCVGGCGAAPLEFCGGPNRLSADAEAATRGRRDVRSDAARSWHSDARESLSRPTGADLGSFFGPLWTKVPRASIGD
jgi:hypothetical protein